MRYGRLPVAIRVLILLALALVVTGGIARAEEVWEDPFTSPEPPLDPAAEMEFFKVESDIVTSVSRHAESSWEVPAAVYVITGEEILASGAERLKDALRMVPGLDVADVDSNLTAISSRGFNGTFVDKMLVLMDGRPIYSPLFGGTLWREWNTFLPDIERIEVIRGPGGTIWGSNAVNGIVNIITKSAEDTHGTLLRGHGGSNSQFQGEARHGGRSGNFHYRLYGRWGSDEGFGGNGGRDIKDERDEVRGGYRFDWNLGRGLSLMSLGEYYDSRLGSAARANPDGRYADDNKYSTELASTIWHLEKDFADGSSGFLRLGAGRLDRRVPFFGTFENERTTWDVEAQHRFRLLDDAVVTWGANARRTHFEITDGAVAFDNPRDTLNVVGGFAQAAIDLGRRSQLTLGSKVENNSFSGTSWQPSVRFVHRFDEDRTAWAAVSRSVNTPAFTDMFVDVQSPPPAPPDPGEPVVVPRFVGTGEAGDATLVAYEAGYRHRLGQRVSIDATAFYNEYDDIAGWNGLEDPLLIANEEDENVLFLTHLHENLGDAFAYGCEAVVRAEMNPAWRAEVNASYFEFSSNGADNPDSPHWKVNLRQFIQAGPRLSIVPTLHWVDGLTTEAVFRSRAFETRSVHVDSYVRVDLAVHYEPGGMWPTVGLVGQNLAERSHLETVDELIRGPTPVTRSWLLTLSKEL